MKKPKNGISTICFQKAVMKMSEDTTMIEIEESSDSDIDRSDRIFLNILNGKFHGP